MRILVVDSFGRSGAILARLLELQGHSARWAVSCADARGWSGREAFDVLITDLELPDGSGPELLRDVSRRRPCAGISISADPRDELFDVSRRAGFVVHLRKPVSFERICAAIAQCAISGPGQA